MNDMFIILGIIMCCYLNKCSYKGDINVNKPNNSIGGLAGDFANGRSGDVEVNNCFVEGNIQGGGIIGRIQPGLGNRMYTYFKQVYFNGIANNPFIMQYYMFWQNGQGTLYVQNSFYNREKTTSNYGSYGTGLTGEQLKDTSNFRNWDFDTIWQMGTNGPELRKSN